MSTSGYRARKRGGTPQRQRLTDTQLVTLMRAIHAELKGAYGSPRRVRELRDRGFPASKGRVERLMRAHGIRARHKRRYKATTDSKHGLPVAENLVARHFAPTAPNQVWTSDITVFQDQLKGYGMTCSMSRKGNCWDNAPTESWFNSFKNERVHGVRYASHDDMRATAFEYIEVFYNRTRKHSTLGYQSPAQYLDQWIKGLQAQKLVA